MLLLLEAAPFTNHLDLPSLKMLFPTSYIDHFLLLLRPRICPISAFILSGEQIKSEFASVTFNTPTLFFLGNPFHSHLACFSLERLLIANVKSFTYTEGALFDICCFPKASFISNSRISTQKLKFLIRCKENLYTVRDDLSVRYILNLMKAGFQRINNALVS